jgi:hypothetical protein
MTFHTDCEPYVRPYTREEEYAMAVLERAQIERENYERLLGEAGRAISAIPFDRVDGCAISTLLSVIAQKAYQAQLPEIAESLEVLACEVEG